MRRIGLAVVLILSLSSNVSTCLASAHRIYHGLHEIGVHAGTGAMNTSDGGALLGTSLAARLPRAIGS